MQEFEFVWCLTHIAWLVVPAVGEGTRVSLLTGTLQVVATQHSAGTARQVDFRSVWDFLDSWDV